MDTSVVRFFLPEATVGRVASVVSRRAGLGLTEPVLGGDLNHQGEEASQPVLGVETGVVGDPDHPDLRGVPAGALRFFLTVRIFHIVASLTPTQTVRAGCTGPGLVR